MDFTQQLIGYYKGEWLEAALLSAFGLTMVAVVIAMWFFIDQNMLLKGLFYPIAFLALFTTLAGGFNVYNNSQRLAAMPTQYAENPKVFVQADVQRFESKNGVNVWWLPLKLLWVALAEGRARMGLQRWPSRLVSAAFRWRSWDWTPSCRAH